MDPFSVIAGVIGIATTGVQASKKAYELFDNIKNGPEEIHTISSDSFALYSVINSLELALQNEDLRNLVCEDEEMMQAVENLKRPLDNCSGILEQLMEKIISRLKSQPDGKGYRMSTFDLKWGMFTKNEVKNIMRRLDSNKATLNAGMSAITT